MPITFLFLFYGLPHGHLVSSVNSLEIRYHLGGPNPTEVLSKKHLGPVVTLKEWPLFWLAVLGQCSAARSPNLLSNEIKVGDKVYLQKKGDQILFIIVYIV